MSDHGPDTRELYPFLDVIEREAQAIREEADAIEASAFVPMPSYPHGWTAFIIDAGRWGGEFPGVDVVANRARCPHTYRVLTAIEGLRLGGFMRLDPHCEIRAHADFRDDDVVRCHLGLRLPPAERARWPELTARLMDVRRTHSAKNESDDARLTLVLDVQMPFVVPDGAFGPWHPDDP